MVYVLFLSLVFTVLPSQIIIITFQLIMSRIWDVIDNSHVNNFEKISSVQPYALYFHLGKGFT